jgi:hypothetical protein
MLVAVDGDFQLAFALHGVHFPPFIVQQEVQVA